MLLRNITSDAGAPRGVTREPVLYRSSRTGQRVISMSSSRWRRHFGPRNWKTAEWPHETDADFAKWSSPRRFRYFNISVFLIIHEDKITVHVLTLWRVCIRCALLWTMDDFDRLNFKYRLSNYKPCLLSDEQNAKRCNAHMPKFRRFKSGKLFKYCVPWPHVSYKFTIVIRDGLLFLGRTYHVIDRCACSGQTARERVWLDEWKGLTESGDLGDIVGLCRILLVFLFCNLPNLVSQHSLVFR